MSDKPATIDEYLAGISKDQRSALQDLREAIQALVPGAEEGFSYGLPAFRLGGRPLVAFGAAKEHCSLYPMSGSVIEKLQEELSEYETSKGTIRFKPGNPLPGELLEKIIRARMAELGE